MGCRAITPEEIQELQRRGRAVELIDVRTPAEYREVHAEPARLVPLDSLDPDAIMRARNRSEGEPLYTICRSGTRGRQAAEKFHAAGYTNVVNVEGGTLAWERAGLPVVRGKKTISLERQVRIAAGSLVALGTALGAFVHPAFLALPAFVGAGLIFAGVTDTCGMGMLLARMPWNGAGESASSFAPEVQP
jgi:rhodanese-related sulfurtransferase